MTLTSTGLLAGLDEKSLSLLFPVGGGAVVTNDWCINIIKNDKC